MSKVEPGVTNIAGLVGEPVEPLPLSAPLSLAEPLTLTTTTPCRTTSPDLGWIKNSLKMQRTALFLMKYNDFCVKSFKD
jgi:hypothetical protein